MAEPLTRFLLIRHAHVDTGAPPGRLCGWFDPPLSPRGQAQVEALPDRPGIHDRPEALYTSTLTRARDVAAALGRIWRLPVQPLDKVREIGCGRFDGMRIDDIKRDYPDIWARNRAQLEDDFTWPGGESYREFRTRVVTTLSDLAGCHTGQRVAVVTHAGVIAQVLGTLEGRAAAVWERDRPAPLTLTEVAWNDGAPASVLRFGVREWP